MVPYPFSSDALLFSLLILRKKNLLFCSLFLEGVSHFHSVSGRCFFFSLPAPYPAYFDLPNFLLSFRVSKGEQRSLTTKQK